MPAHENMPIVPLLLVGGIGYYLYSKGYFSSLANAFGAGSSIANMLNSPVTPGGAPQGTLQPANTNPPVPPTAPVTPPATGNVKQQMLDYVRANLGFLTNGSFATYDQWNWLRSQYEAAPQGIENVMGPIARDTLLTFDNYWAALESKGISGLGQILDFSDFFSSTRKRQTDTATGKIARINTNFR